MGRRQRIFTAAAVAVRRMPSWGWVLAVLVVYELPVLATGRVHSAADIVYFWYAPWSLAAVPGYHPSNAALVDSVVSLYPAMSFVRESLAAGSLPLWNPYTEFGNPMFAQSQWGMASPIQIPYLLPPAFFSIGVATTLVVMIKLTVAGLGADRLALHLGCARPARVFAGVAFALGGFLTAWSSMPISSSYVLLPWVCVGIERALRRDASRLISTALLALAMAAWVGGGHPEGLLMMALGLALYAVIRLWQERRALAGRWLGVVGVLVGGSLLAAGLMAFMLLPAVELLLRSVETSQRGALPGALAQSLDALRYVIMPDRNGTPMSAPGSALGYIISVAPWFAGVSTAILAVVALLLRDRRAVPFAALCLAAVLIVTNSPPWRAVGVILPFVDGAVVTAALSIWGFALALLAAIGLDAVTRRIDAHGAVIALRTRAVAERAVPLAAVVAVLAVVVVTAELVTWGGGFFPAADRSRATPRIPPALERVPAGPGEPRTLFMGAAVRPLLPLGFDRGDVRGYGQPTREDYDGFMKRVVSDLGETYGSYTGYRLDTVSPQGLRALAAANVAFVAATPHAGVASSTPTEVVLADRPLAFWPFDETSGRRPDDASPHRARALLARGATPGKRGRPLVPSLGVDGGVQGHSVELDGLEGHVALPALPLARHSFTVEAWLRIDEPLGRLGCWFTSRGSESRRKALHLCVTDHDPASPGLGLVFAFFDDNLDVDESKSGVEVGGWHHIVATYDEPSRMARLYVDGSEVGSGHHGPFLAQNARSELGRYRGGQIGMPGLIDDVAIYDYPLTADRVDTHWEAGTLVVSAVEPHHARAYVARRYEVEPDTIRAQERVAAEGFDPMKDVVLDRRPAGVDPARRDRSGGVDITHYSNNRVELSVDLDAPAVVVLSDSIYPGWSATVDGGEVPIMRANGLFRAVAVPAGDHAVVFRFRPRSIMIGAVLSLLSLVLVAGLLVAGRRRPTTQPGDA